MKFAEWNRIPHIHLVRSWLLLFQNKTRLRADISKSDRHKHSILKRLISLFCLEFYVQWLYYRPVLRSDKCRLINRCREVRLIVCARVSFCSLHTLSLIYLFHSTAARICWTKSSSSSSALAPELLPILMLSPSSLAGSFNAELIFSSSL